jgi:hypothetical protein
MYTAVLVLDACVVQAKLDAKRYATIDAAADINLETSVLCVVSYHAKAELMCTYYTPHYTQHTKCCSVQATNA